MAKFFVELTLKRKLKTQAIIWFHSSHTLIVPSWDDVIKNLSDSQESIDVIRFRWSSSTSCWWWGTSLWTEYLGLGVNFSLKLVKTRIEHTETKVGINFKLFSGLRKSPWTLRRLSARSVPSVGKFSVKCSTIYFRV